MQIVKFPNFIMESVQVDKRRNILSYQDAKMDYSLSFLEESFDYKKLSCRHHGLGTILYINII